MGAGECGSPSAAEKQFTYQVTRREEIEEQTNPRSGCAHSDLQNGGDHQQHLPACAGKHGACRAVWKMLWRYD